MERLNAAAGTVTRTVSKHGQSADPAGFLDRLDQARQTQAGPLGLLAKKWAVEFSHLPRAFRTVARANRRLQTPRRLRGLARNVCVCAASRLSGSRVSATEELLPAPLPVTEGRDPWCSC